MILFTMQVTSIFKVTKSLIIHSDKKNFVFEKFSFLVQVLLFKIWNINICNPRRVLLKHRALLLILSFISGGPVFLLPTLLRGEGEGEMF